jgi:hypothetical protein
MFIEIFESNSLSAVHKLARDQYGEDIFVLKCTQEKGRFKILVACDEQADNAGRPRAKNSMEHKSSLPLAPSQEDFIQSSERHTAQHQMPDKLDLLETVPAEKNIDLRESRIIFFENERQRFEFSKALHQSASGFEFVHLLGEKSAETIKLSAASVRDYSIDSLEGLIKHVTSQTRDSIVIGTALIDQLGVVIDKFDSTNFKVAIAISESSINAITLNKEYRGIDEIFITGIHEDANYFNIGALFSKSNISPSLGLMDDPRGRFVTLNRDIIVSLAKRANNVKAADPASELKMALSRLSRSMEAPNESYYDSRS